jgi:hypothetical protein
MCPCFAEIQNSKFKMQTLIHSIPVGERRNAFHHAVSIKVGLAF